MSRDDINSLTREEQRVRTTAKADAMARLALLFNQRLTQGRVVDPAGDSAKFYLAQLVQSDAYAPSTLLARQSFATRTLDEARGAVRKQDYAAARRWLTEAHDAGADDASIADVNRDIAGAPERCKTGAPRRSSRRAALQRTHYVAPGLPGRCGHPRSERLGGRAIYCQKRRHYDGRLDRRRRAGWHF